jgi:hypothetical protein
MRYAYDQPRSADLGNDVCIDGGERQRRCPAAVVGPLFVGARNGTCDWTAASRAKIAGSQAHQRPRSRAAGTYRYHVGAGAMPADRSRRGWGSYVNCAATRESDRRWLRRYPPHTQNTSRREASTLVRSDLEFELRPFRELESWT